MIGGRLVEECFRQKLNTCIGAEQVKHGRRAVLCLASGSSPGRRGNAPKSKVVEVLPLKGVPGRGGLHRWTVLLTASSSGGNLADVESSSCSGRALRLDVDIIQHIIKVQVWRQRLMRGVSPRGLPCVEG